MKVLFITAVSGMSGSEIVLIRFLRRNSDVRAVLLVPRGPLQLQLGREGNRVYISRGLGQLHRSRNPFWPLVFVIRWLLGGIEIIRVCRKEHPQIIQATHFAAAIYAALPAKLLGIPIVWHIHDIIAPRTLGAWVCRFLGQRVGRMIAVSHAVKQALVNVGVPSWKIAVVHNGIDSAKEFNPERISRGTLRQQYRLDAQELLVGFLGLLVPWKGAHLFLNAIEGTRTRLHRPVRFLIIGDSWSLSDRYKESLLEKARAAGLGDLVLFTGRLANIPAVLADLDVVVHASLDPDPLPNVILEAMAMEKLILASNLGGVPEMIEDGTTGLLYPSGDMEALARLLLRSIHDFEDLASLGRQARCVTTHRFTEASQRSAFARIYREVTPSPSIPDAECGTKHVDQAVEGVPGSEP